MKLTKVTLTGADDSVKPEQLFEISERFPFVEWGILLSRRSFGNKRFPSRRWLNELQAYSDLNDTPIRSKFLSAHLCGDYVREILVGDIKLVEELGAGLWGIFQRVQINTHGIEHERNIEKMAKELLPYSWKEYIHQYDDANENILLDAVANRMRVATLFDLSHGAGVLPSQWPKPFKGIHCGYAGGLSPDNIVQQLGKIQSVAGEFNVWVDMETQIRSDDGKVFDLGKCQKVLELCEPFVL